MITTSPEKRERRTQIERSSETRRRLLDAAFEVLKERGYAEFTTTDVVKRAGVSRGAMAYHFPSKNDLVSATIEDILNKSLERSIVGARLISKSGDPIEGIIRDAAAFYFSDYFYVGLEMLLAVDKNPQINISAPDLVRNYRQSAEDAWRKVMVDLGFPEEWADDILWMTVSLLRGGAIRALWRNEPNKIRRIMDLWRDMVRCYLAAKPLSRPRRESPFD